MAFPEFFIIFEHCFQPIINLEKRNMANKRDLKRTINYITSELFAETVVASLYNEAPQQADVEGILSSIVMVNEDFIKRVSHPEPGIKPGEYYKRLIADFGKQVCEIIDQISNLG